MSDIQVCEGVWRNRIRQRVVVTRCEPVNGQRWTDGAYHFGDDGNSVCDRDLRVDLVEYIGPLPDQLQRAPVSRPAETESTTAVAGSVSDDPGRIIYDLEKRLKAANAEIQRLKESHDKATETLQAEHIGEREAFRKGFRIAVNLMLEDLK